ncbi:MAG: MFS transporter [Pseudomonadota bacterium]
MSHPNSLTATERRATIGLAAVYGTRMAGFFLMLPVFALFAEGMPGSTPALAGLAVGIYGLMQALGQIPLGLWSDHIGRKPVIIGGLALFALGSMIAALADHIVWVIIGRAIQGSGAVAAAILALAADLTRPEQRTKVMAGIGMTIGAAFILSLVTAPVLHPVLGHTGIFWLCAGLAVVAAGIVLHVVPDPPAIRQQSDVVPVPHMIKSVLCQRALLQLDIGIFALHLILTATFLALPIVLQNAGLPLTEHAWVYLPVLLFSLLGMAPFIWLSSRQGWAKPILSGAVLILCIALLVLWQSHDSLTSILVGLSLFFLAFNLLEAKLPALISKAAPPEAKGTAMGVFTTAQFFGAFSGGLLGGWVHAWFDLATVFLCSAMIAAGWCGMLMYRQAMRCQ